MLRSPGYAVLAEGATAIAGGVDTQVQFNDGGVINGSTGLTFTKGNGGATSMLTLGALANVVAPAAATWQLGAVDAAAPVAQTLQVQSVAAATANTAGVNWTKRASLSTGTGAAGTDILQTSFAGVTQSAASVTVTSASPGVVTLNNHGFVPGQPFQFGGTTAPAGTAKSVTYYVLASGLTVNTFQFALTLANWLAGTAANTSSTGTAVTLTTDTSTQNPASALATWGPSGLTGSQTTSLLSLAQTWNTSGNVTGLLANFTNIAAGASSLLADLQVGGTSQWKVAKAGAVTQLGSLSLAADAATFSLGASSDVILARAAAASLQLGAADVDTNAAIVAQTLRSQGTLAGGTSDQAGKDWTLIASPGKGTGVGGKFLFQAAKAGSTGTTVNSAATVFTLDSVNSYGLFPAGTSLAAPLKFTSGTNLGTAAAGAVEWDGVNPYFTNDTTGGRGAIPVEQYFHLTSAGSTISTIANYFGATSNISLVASAYYIIDVYAWFLNTTSGTVVWTLTNSAAPTSQNIFYEMSPITGIVAPPGTATMLVGQIRNDATAALALTATGNLTDAVSHYMHMRIYLQNGTGTSLKIQATKSAGTITPGINSYWVARRISPNNIGTFAA
jgi:hypothetical protein